MRSKTKDIKVMQGTFEASREPEDAVEYSKYEINPAAPSGWPPNIQKLWSDRCNDLKSSGYLVKAFIAPLRRYCFAVMMAEEAEKNLMDQGFVTVSFGAKGQEYEVVSKWVQVLKDANKIIIEFGSKFGFSPLDIQKIPVVERKQKTMSLLK